MGLRISTNSAATSIHRILSESSLSQTKDYQRLASGQRITGAGDDAAGLSISENLRMQVNSMSQAEKNANDGISFAQVAEGGLTEISNIIIRLRELGIQAASDTIGDRERNLIHQEVQSLTQEIDRIANVTQFNGTSLLNAQAKHGLLQLQVGIHNTENDHIIFDANAIDVRTKSLGLNRLNFQTIEGASDGLEKIDTSLEQIFSSRASLGAMQNNLESTIRNLNVTKENLDLARSRIADTDIAATTSALVRDNILQASGIAVLTQANSAPGQVLKLLS